MKQAADQSRRHGRSPEVPLMRALRYDGGEARLDRSFPTPQPGRGEALIRTLKAAVSAIDLEICRGLLSFSGTLGHEFVGRVDFFAVRHGSQRRHQRDA